MQLFTIKQAQDNLSTLIDEVTRQHLPIAISSEHNDAILVSKEDWESIQETLYLNQIPKLVDSIKQASQESIEDCIGLENLEW